MTVGALVRDPDREADPPDRDPIFGDDPVSDAAPLIEGLALDDGLQDVYVVRNLESYYSSKWSYLRPPLIMAPSSAKALYGLELRPLWRGIGLNGSNWGGLTIIGLSLRPTDQYLRQVLYTLTSEYTWNFQEGKGWGRPGRIKIIDLRSEPDVRNLRDGFQFIDWQYVDLTVDGFSMDSIDPLFMPPGPLWAASPSDALDAEA